jgi:selenocysteine lyase/cysteine desulfurase
MACLNSLDYIQQCIENIQAHRQPLLSRLQSELPRLGFQVMGPSGSASPTVAFAKQDAREVAARIKQARNRCRHLRTESAFLHRIYNDLADVDKLLEALS